jgi:hypothetical protein
VCTLFQKKDDFRSFASTTITSDTVLPAEFFGCKSDNCASMRRGRERSKKKKIFAFSYCCICFLYRVRVFATKRETKISTMKFVNAYNRKRNLYIYWLFLHLDRMSLLLTFILSMGIQCRKFWELFVATIVSSYW